MPLLQGGAIPSIALPSQRYSEALILGPSLNRGMYPCAMPRSATPARATKALVAELNTQGVDCSPRRLEDWRRVGLIPRGRRHSLGRGRGTEVVYPDDMVERCRRVAERMRRGQPWQMVALSLFAAGAELPEETIRSAYRWALRVEAPTDDELDAAEDGVGQLLSTAAGRRLQAQVAVHVKRSGVAPNESPASVARSVLTNLFVIHLGGEVASDEAMIEVLAGMGLPITELPPEGRIEAARLMGSVMSAFSAHELADVAGTAPVEELRSAVPVVAQVLEMVPAELRALVPRPVAELLPVLLAPMVVQAHRLEADVVADVVAHTRAPERSVASPASQRPATMDRMLLPGPSEHHEREERSA